MNKFVLMSDSTCDLTQEIVDREDIKIIPLTMIIDKKEFPYTFDGKGLDIKDFYQRMRDGLVATTAQVNVEACEDFYRPYLEEGLDILYVCFSSGLSGTYNSACLAAKNLLESYPNRKIIVIDSLCACSGEGLLALEAAKFRKEGLCIDEVASKIEDLKHKVAHWFTVENLEYLRRGGRLSNGKAFIGKVLGIKPVLDVSGEGKLQSLYTVHGRNKSLTALVENTMKTIDKDYEFTTFICNADCNEEAEKLKAELEIKYKENNVKTKEIIITTMGPIIGAHAGPGTIAIFTVSTGRIEPKK